VVYVHSRAAEERRARRRPDGRQGELYAALDLGTNNCRLLVARPTPDSFRVVDAFSRIVRLGERLEASGELSEAAMERTIEALKICAGKLRRHHIAAFRGVATEACRRAHNGAAFLSRATAETGLELEIIEPREETGLALAGCAPLLDDARRHAIMFDIGGGSTEVAWLARDASEAWSIAAAVSLDCGVVAFAERYGGDVIDTAQYEAMVAEILGRLRGFDAAYDIARHTACDEVQMLGTSGTVTTLAGVRMNLPRYDRSRVDGSWLDFSDIVAVTRQLASLDWRGRAANPCIGRERADLVVAGCAILEAICRLWPVGRLRVADRGLREGILLGLMREAAARSHAAPT
jgi:exopolyphosphatase/guanosine-5'-triphosphate,3'-diphosphate pyrophosphatase